LNRPGVKENGRNRKGCGHSCRAETVFTGTGKGVVRAVSGRPARNAKEDFSRMAIKTPLVMLAK
jgi:hypothetical protein